MGRLRKWLAEERDFIASHTHREVGKARLNSYLKDGWKKEHLLDMEGYSGTKFAQVGLGSKDGRAFKRKVVVDIPGRGREIFNMLELIEEIEKQNYQPTLFST